MEMGLAEQLVLCLPLSHAWHHRDNLSLRAGITCILFLMFHLSFGFIGQPEGCVGWWMWKCSLAIPVRKAWSGAVQAPRVVPSLLGLLPYGSEDTNNFSVVSPWCISGFTGGPGLMWLCCCFLGLCGWRDQSKSLCKGPHQCWTKYNTKKPVSLCFCLCNFHAY